MVKRLPIYEIGEIDRLRFSLNEWVWNSHYWVETSPGYYKCEWCGKHWSYNYLGEYNSFCKENLKIKELLQKRE